MVGLEIPKMSMAQRAMRVIHARVGSLCAFDAVMLRQARLFVVEGLCLEGSTILPRDTFKHRNEIRERSASHFGIEVNQLDLVQVPRPCLHQKV